MGDRAHLRRQGDMRGLESGVKPLPESQGPAYSAVPNGGSSFSHKAERSLNYQLF